MYIYIHIYLWICIGHYDAILMDFVMPNMDGPTGIYEFL
jgi:CheY-like chemotaxis protein